MTDYSAPETRLRELAAGCLGRRNEGRLSCSLSESDQEILIGHAHADISVKGDKLNFAGAEVRDQLAAEHHYFDKAEKGAPDHLSVALEIRNQEGWSKKGAAGRYLALASNDIDIFATASDAIISNGSQTFEVLGVVEAALPYLERLPIASLISLCEAQYEHTKRDLMRGQFFTALSDRFKDEPNIFREIIAAIHDGLSDSTSSLYTTSVLSLAESAPLEATNQAIGDASAANHPVLVSNALWSLGRLTFLRQVPALQQEKIDKILEGKTSDSNDDIQLAAFVAVCNGAIVHPPLAEVLNRLLETKNKMCLAALAEMLFQYSEKAKPNPNYDRWLSSLAFLPAELEGALRNLDMVLLSHLDDGSFDLVISFLENWLVQQGSEISRKKEIIAPLKMAFQKLLEAEEVRARLISEWLVSDHRELHRAVEAILSDLQVHKILEVKFHPETITAFDTETLILLFRRMLGFVIFEGHLLSLTLSVLDIDDAEQNTHKLVEEVLTNEIGLDFPFDTINRLKDLKEERDDLSIKALCDRVIDSIDSYFDALKKLPRIKELEPSRELVLRISKQQAKTMDVHKKVAEESSIIRHIASVVPLKAGIASFSFRGGAYSEPSHLHAFEHSITLPRRYCLDAVGFEMRGLHFRVAKRGQ